MKKRVLFVDNDPDFLDTRAERLEREGFEVFKASSSEKAEQILNEHWVHLAVIDVRLRDDNDERDTSGLALAKREAYRTIPKIVLTRFPSYEYVREALGPALEGLPPAVDFVAKQEGPEAMIQAIEEAFFKYLPLNWNLNIRWRNQHSFYLLANWIETGVESTSITDRVDELTDLFRRLFYDSTQITIDRILVQREGLAILKVFAHSQAGIHQQFVVSCGRRRTVNEEVSRYETFAPKGAGRGSTSKVRTEETVHFAATAYTLIGGDLDETVTFREFYQGGSVDELLLAVDHLFTSTLAPWYEKGRSLTEFDSDWFSLDKNMPSQMDLEGQVEGLCRQALATGLGRIDCSPHKLTFHFPDGSSVLYPNPVGYSAEKRIMVDQPVLWGVVHGSLDADTVLVDREGTTWLVGFNQAGQGSLFRDFASLEAAIKFDVLDTLDVQARHDLERRLLAVSRLDEEADADNLAPDLQKAIYAVVRIRNLASKVMGDGMDACLASLLVCAMGRLAGFKPEVRYTRHELIAYLHSLLLAGMICHQLTPPPREDLPRQAIHNLWVDESNREVWVEGRLVSLSSQEFELLLYLYRHPGQLCSRTAIAEQVFGVAYEPDMPDNDKRRMEEGRINSTMSRLRKKLEPDPSRPKYITVVRGEGYRFNFESDAENLP